MLLFHLHCIKEIAGQILDRLDGGGKGGLSVKVFKITSHFLNFNHLGGIFKKVCPVACYIFCRKLNTRYRDCEHWRFFLQHAKRATFFKTPLKNLMFD